MIRKNIIRSISALVLIVLFVFSITPKKTLHDIFGCHPESAKSIKLNGKQQVAMDGFQCSCQQPDLQPPYIEQQLFAGLTLTTIYFPSAIPFYTVPLYERAVLFSTLRGPPSLV